LSLALMGLLATAHGLGSASAGPSDVEVSAAGGGERLFALRCGICHSVEPGQQSPVGPSLAGVVGRRAGSLKPFPYSAAMKSLNLAWTGAALDQFLQNPAAMVPGTRMAFAGLKDAGQRQAIIEYLAKFK